MTLDIVSAEDPRYQRLRHVYCAQGSPAAIVRVRTADEVPAALAFARASGRPFAVRSGGHGISSIATNNGGTVIDLGDLNRVEPLDGRRVRIGPGARWSQVARVLQPLGLAISSGDFGDVGVGGLATAGGIGLLGRLHGLTIDHLVGADIVTADGILRHASADENPELFWAIQGAGANFGIVTSFDFDAAPVGQVTQASVTYVAADTTGLLEAWGDAVERAPRKVSAFLYLVQGFAQATIVFAGDDPSATSRAFEPFTALPGYASGQAVVVPYASVLMTTNTAHTGQQVARARSGLAHHLDRALAAGLDAVLSAGADMVQVRSVGGTINDKPADATAYAHRHQNFSVAAISTRSNARFHAAWKEARAYFDGMYLSFQSSHGERDVARAYPPPTLERLRILKGMWDPQNFFAQNFGITPDFSPPEVS